MEGSFLSANTAAGFYSVYEDLANPEHGDKIWYIKGGPGNGKSTFMRRTGEAAEAAGHHVEYFLCSGDPDSLDGIYIRELKTAYVDATAPHVQEPSLPGISGRYLDLSQFYRNTASLDSDAIAVLLRGYREQYARAYDLLAAAGRADPLSIPGAITRETRERLYEEGREYALRLLPPGRGVDRSRRFISAISCLGSISLPGIAYANGVVCLVNSAHWLAGAMDACLEKNQRLILCPDPLQPEKIDGLILPDTGISFLMAHKGVRYPSGKTRHVSAETGVEGSMAAEYRQAKSVQTSLLRMAFASLKKAKELHDALEAAYRPAVDFKALDRFTARHIREHIGSQK